MVQFELERLTVQSLRYNEQEIAGAEFEVLPGENGKLEALAPFNLGEVAGAVELADGRPPKQVVVFLAKESEPQKLLRVLSCDPDGHFRSRDIPPGEYVAGVIIRNFDGIPQRGNETKVCIHANERITLDFRVLANS